MSIFSELKTKAIWCLLALFVAPLTGLAAEHPILPLGSAAPDFSLPGVDGKIHKLNDYASSKVLVVVFTCDHCPNAQMYEGRVTQLYNDYKDKGVALVAINPNDPKAIRIDELDSSDVSDTLDEMKIRVAYKHLQYPYLYDGETEAVSRAYGPQASPHIFIFDQQRKLRYEGAIDDSYRIEFVKRHYALDAITALLADQEVAVKHTGAFGCTTKWSDKEAANVAFMEKLNAQPVSLDTVSADALKALRTNADGNVRLIQFWSTRCSECLKEFAGIQDIYRMYSNRNFELVVVAMNKPEEKPVVAQWLEKTHATSRNLLFDSEHTAALQKAFDPKWEAGPEVPYTILLDADGNVLYQTDKPVDQLKLRRTILANLPSAYIGLNNYWLEK
ncbi:MAG: redoxin domain-containing protein [Acidobacteriaceae bacterium]